MPGEKTSPTQPFPTKPPPFDRQGVTEDDLVDFTPEIKAEALEIASKFQLGPIFTPLIVQGELDKLGTFVVPGAGGGATHIGASYDPEAGYLYVESMTLPTGMSLVKPESGESQTVGLPASGKSGFNYEIKYQSTAGPRGLPLVKPPYRRLTAIDMKAGEHVFQVPQGRGVTDHPSIKHLDLGPMGSSYLGVAEGGILVTKTMLVSYLPHEPDMGGVASEEDVLGFVRRRPPGGFLRALDKSTGAVIAQIEVDRTLYSIPITYAHEGRQYIAVAGGGVGRGLSPEKEELIVYALPTQ